MELTRAHVLSHRWRAQQLDRAAGPLAVLDLGVADVPTPAAATALAIRGGAPDDDLALVWGARGAPFLHRRSDLQTVADAIWPASDEDATRRIANPRIEVGAKLGIEAFRTVAEAVHDVLSGAEDLVTKSDLSRGVSERIPDSLNHDCEPCGSRHVSGSVLQDAGLAGGAELVRGGRSTRFRLLPGVRVPQQRKGLETLVTAYLHLCGPATPTDIAAYFALSVADVRTAWPADTVELTADEDSLRSGARARGVRLLPAGDPWLQARDRAFLVPREHHARVWKAISPPGAVLVDGEVVGTWRAATKGRRVDLTIEPFALLPDRVREALADKAVPVATGRGVAEARIVQD